MRITAILAVLSISIGFAANAYAGNVDDDMRRVQQQIKAMERTRSSNNAQIASALSQFGALQDEFAALKGQIQTNKHMISSQYQDIGKRVTDLDHRIQAIEDRLQIFSTQLSKALGKVDPKAAAEGDLYQKGLDQVENSRYLEAAASFQSYVKKYPKSKFTPSAKYWIAECFYSMRDYQRAIKEYQNFIEKYPRSSKVPEALLNQGNSFYELGMIDESKAFYDQVIKKYPSSTQASTAKDRLARIEARKSQAAKPASTGSYPEQTIEQQRQQSAF